MNGLSIWDLESGYEDKLIIRNLSMGVGPEETLVLMGPSGSGKTTLLPTILGIICLRKAKFSLTIETSQICPLKGATSDTYRRIMAYSRILK